MNLSHRMTLTTQQLNLDDILRERLQTDRAAIEEFCRQYKITEFSLFGSVLRDDFRATGKNPSDADVLIVFAPEHGWSLFNLMDMERELEELFHRPIDLSLKDNLENPYRRTEVLNSHQVIYAAN